MQRHPSPAATKWLSRAAIFVAVIVFGLIIAGAQVTSNDAGLAVPDWPKAYGAWFPDRWLSIRNIFIEHFHRIYAFTVGLSAVGLASAFQLLEPRRAVRRVALLLPVMVLGQGLIGAARVLLFGKLWIAMLHGVFGQLTFAAFVALAVLSSRRWRDGEDAEGSAAAPKPAARRGIIVAMALLLFTQLVLGAVMRHERAGLAIPDFPLLHGALPKFTGAAVTLAFTHRLLGAGVCAALLLQAWRLRAAGPRMKTLALGLAALAMAQIGLGMFTVISGRNPWLASLHTANGALLLAGQTALLLWAFRPAFHDDREALTASSPASSATQLLRGAS
jgi:cytochrome c oxidase assembly protein subunit 15